MPTPAKYRWQCCYAVVAVVDGGGGNDDRHRNDADDNYDTAAISVAAGDS